MRGVLGAGDLQPHAQGGILGADVDGVPALRNEELLIVRVSTRVKRGTGTQQGEGEAQHEGSRHRWSFLRPEASCGLPERRCGSLSQDACTLHKGSAMGSSPGTVHASLSTVHKGMARARSSPTGFCTPHHQHWRSNGLPCITGRLCTTTRVICLRRARILLELETFDGAFFLCQ